MYSLQIYHNTKDYVFRMPGVGCACQLGQKGVLKAVECACVVSEYSNEKLHGLKNCLTVDKQAKPTSKSIYQIIPTWLSLVQCLYFKGDGLDLENAKLVDNRQEESANGIK